MNPPKTKGKGGKRPGAGRPPDWLKEKCKSLIDKNELLEFVARVASGEETETVVLKSRDSSETVEVQCSTKDRLHAVEMLLDRGFGKALQGVEIGAPGGGPLTVHVVNYAVKS